ncbi:polygalacturonase non-catalytic subunit AroGP3 [Nicotiana tabacum]|uniref:Polygalacturonase non-catalytic subunit AroGP3 n=1 Tax=Nicotiana tabacum TaxID=4097 RepID=A0A1S4CKZ4_TOBAC
MHTNTLLFCIFLLFRVIVAGNRDNSGDSINPFTPKAYLIRYWKKQISNQLPKPWFLLNKASPLNAAQFATYSKLAGDQESLSKEISSFCSSANLLCFPDISSSLEKYGQDVQFSSYMSKNFTNYGSKLPRGFDSFKKYAENDNLPVNSFRQYSRGGAGHDDKFSTYAPNGNVVDQSFNTYGTGLSAGGVSEFKNYAPNVNVPNLRFTTYSTEVAGRKQSFTSYTKDTNSGDQSFTSYGKNSNGAVNDFTSYANNSNVIGSTFTNYGESGNGGGNTFKSYGSNANVPENSFKNYGVDGNAPFETFINYRDKSNVGDDKFTSYVDDPNAGKANFENYGQSFGEGSDTFSKYGSGITDAQTVGFKTYGVNTTFKEYGKTVVTFADYKNKTINQVSVSSSLVSDKNAKNKWIEPGKFFREKMLKTGTIMPMPDIRDKMPKRSFLPRVIASKLPFSTSKISDLKTIFHARDDSQMGKMMSDALTECERSPSAGETKRCVNSVEDMIDFSTSVLGRDVVVRTTENTKGSKGNIMIGSVKGINGGKVTKSVSCHQSLFPYLVYYCHSVPKVRVYEADILDPNSKAKINHGIAICHVDTSSWGANHGAFIALGSGPGKIEVCHWIFENDMTWAVAD